MNNDKEWRYINYSQEAIDNIHNHNPEDLLIAMIDGDITEEEDYSFSFHQLLDETKLLTNKQKIVLYKRIVEGKTFEQIGKECKTSRQNCHELYQKAIIRLKGDILFQSYRELWNS